MAKTAPTECPKCRAAYSMRAIGERNGGFSGGKAVIGAVIAGPIGVASRRTRQKENNLSVPQMRLYG